MKLMTSPRPENRVRSTCSYISVSYTHLDVYKRQIQASGVKEVV